MSTNTNSDDDRPCLILEVSGCAGWEPRFEGSKRIPEDNRPTTLQPNRRVAEEEARRLAAAHSRSVFVVLEAVSVGATLKTPTHVNLRGEVVIEKHIAAVTPIATNDDYIPF